MRDGRLAKQGKEQAMEIVKNNAGQAMGVKFEEFDSIREIASVMRCTSFELIGLVNYLKENDWAGEEISILKKDGQ